MMKNLPSLLIVVSMVASGPAFAGAENTSQFAKAVNRLMAVSFQSDSLGLMKAIDTLKHFTENPELAYLAHYYMAFGKWQWVLRRTTIQPGAVDAIGVLDEAIAELDSIIELKGDFVEAHVLSLNCHYALFYLAPQRRTELAVRVAALKKSSLEIGPENPRVVLTDAQNIFYKPEQFGGSQERGITRFKEAIQMFEKQQESLSALGPDWGHEMAYAWLGNAYLRMKEPNIRLAKEAFEKSLQLRPDFAWVKDIMLPQIEKQLSETARK